MKLTIYQVDSFSEKPFKGNPAGVCVTDEILDVELMQNIAMEMNLSETAFVVPQAKTSVAGDPDGQRLYDLRWFTPKCEVDLCGHGTLAAAHILFTEYGITGELNFKTRSGILSAVQSSDGIVLDFPATDVEESPLPEDLKPLFSEGVLYTGKTEDLLFVELPTEMDIRNFKPDFSILKEAGIAELIITAWAGTKEETGGYNVASRVFAPGFGIDEDPVTGAAHCVIGPYWQKKRGVSRIAAFQASRRGGFLTLEMKGDRVTLAGKAVTVFRAQMNL